MLTGQVCPYKVSVARSALSAISESSLIEHIGIMAGGWRACVMRREINPPAFHYISLSGTPRFAS